MNSFKVVCTSVTFGSINKEPLERLTQAGCTVITNNLGRPLTEEEIVERASDADALIVGTDKVPSSVIDRLKNIKIIAKHGVGYDSIDLESTQKRGIFVTNVPASNSNEVADLVFGFIIALARNIHLGNKEVKQGIWHKRSGISLFNKTIGVIGTGNIGLETIKRANGFGMKVLAYDLYENQKALDLGTRYASLETLLSTCDFISLHLPYNETTRHIINHDALSKMKESVILVNTAREQLVDLKALEAHLKINSIRGYATDVYETEPPLAMPIFDYDNVLVSPHIGATTVDANLVMGNGAVDCVLRVKDGERPHESMIRNRL